MSGKIKILDKKTINQIAAGEVVERPASIVKELLENSLDAHALKLVIELESAGRKLIRVTDDGDGLAPEDIRLAFDNHSTSKISKIDDIYNLTTLGFRGEALASIAAVARVECITCDGKNLPGRRLVSEGGEVRTISEVGCAKGTTMKVKDVFFNLPARYKYLKSDQTELAHIIDIVTHLAISHYSVGFKLVHNGNELLNFPRTKNQINNLVNIYGKELARNLLSIPKRDFTGDIIEDDNAKTVKTNNLSISGFIGKPSITRSDRSYQSLFVNGRYVESDCVHEAIKNAYRTLVMKNRYPFVILFIEISPDEIDVNISPTKLQIRFENEKKIYNTVYNIIRETLQKHELIPEVDTLSKPQTITLKAITTFGVGKPGFHTSLPVPSKHCPSSEVRGQTRNSGGGTTNTILTQSRLHSQEYTVNGQTGQTEQIGESITSNGTAIKLGQKLDTARSPVIQVQGSTLPSIRPLGQILDTYIIAQAGEDLLIIDQHAAHERIMYEKIKQRYYGATMSTQELIEPVELELAPKELGLLKTNMHTMSELKFIIDELSENSYFVKGIPLILGRLQNPEIIHDIITDIIEATSEKEPDKIKDKMIQVMACKAAIKAGKELSMPEIIQLINELYLIENPYTCAHGRPTIISLTETQLRKMFKRIV